MLKTKQKLIGIFLGLFVTVSLSAQFTATGTVTDAGGQAIIGATVLIKGTSIGESTDIDGKFSLNIPGNASTLEISYLGFSTISVDITAANPDIEIILTEETSLLDEVIVTGYSLRRRGAFTGSLESVEAKQLDQIPMASAEAALQGKITGVQATAIDGTPGGNVQVRIRGIGSIGASSEPLYVIDGIAVQSGNLGSLNDNGGRSNNVMAGLNPNDIESMTVLKDAASTAIYGSRGANGVILITTKSGQSGKTQINLKTQVGFNSVASNNIMQPLNAEQYTQLFLEGYTNGGSTPAQAQTNLENRFGQLTDPATGRATNTNWLDEITRTGLNHSYDLSARGGSDNVTYFFSGNYFDQESHIIGSDFNRISGRMNLDFKANENLTISNKLSVSNTDQNGFVDGSAWANPLYNAYLLSPLIPIFDETGLYNSEHKNYFPMGGNNPVGALSGDDERLTTQLRLTDNFSVSYSFLDDFVFKSQVNMDVIQLNESQYKNRRYGDGRNIGGYAQVYTTLDKNWSATQTLNYLPELSGEHSLGVLVGYEAQKSNRETTYGFGQEFPNDKLKTLASAAASYDASATRTEYSFQSVFGSVNYGFKSKYYLDLTYRRDGSSRFGSDNRYGDFYSIGAAWTITDEPFISNAGWIDYLKLRSSFGITGNASIGNFPSRGLYGYGRDYDGAPGGEPAQIANPDLTWESQENFNVGIDFNLFKDIKGTFEYFTRLSTELLLDVPISYTTGFGELTQNFGEMKNAGYEISLSATIIKKTDFRLELGINTTILKNKLAKLSEAYTDGTKRREEGRDYQSYYLYGWAGVDQTNGDPLWYTDETESETTNRISNASRYFVDRASATPDHFGGASLDITYKAFSLSSNFTYSAGNYLYDVNGRFIHGDGRLTPRSTSVWGFENRWVPGKTDALLPLHDWGDTKGGQNANNSRYLFDGTYFRLRNLTVAYDLPAETVAKLKFSSIRAYFRATNLLTWTKDSDLFLDPEQAINGNSNSLTPAIKTISFGIDFGF